MLINYVFYKHCNTGCLFIMSPCSSLCNLVAGQPKTLIKNTVHTYSREFDLNWQCVDCRATRGV